MGLKDGEALGIISLDPKGRTPEVLWQLDEVQPPQPREVSAQEKKGDGGTDAEDPGAT